MPIRVLIIDADRAFGAHLSNHLLEEGWQVRQANDKSEVFELISQQRFEVAVVSGHSLGHQSIEIIKQLHGASSDPEIILLITQEQLSLAISAQQSGIFDDIFVPCDTTRLKKTIKSAARCHKRKQLKKWYQDQFAAAGLAESGDLDTARDLLSRHQSPRQDKKGGHNE